MTVGVNAGGNLGSSAALGATFASAPGYPSAAAGTQAAPGAAGPGSSMTPHQAAIVLIMGSLIMLVAVGWVFRRGPIAD